MRRTCTNVWLRWLKPKVSRSYNVRRKCTKVRCRWLRTSAKNWNFCFHPQLLDNYLLSNPNNLTSLLLFPHWLTALPQSGDDHHLFPRFQAFRRQLLTLYHTLCCISSHSSLVLFVASLYLPKSRITSLCFLHSVLVLFVAYLSLSLLHSWITISGGLHSSLLVVGGSF